MCGRYTLTSEAAALAERFALDAPEQIVLPRYNIAPGQEAPVIVNDGRSRLHLMRWGLVPSWAREPRDALINARAETLGQKPSFREAFARRRCLVPADGFYEWRRRPGVRKAPMRFTLKNGELFAFAGLWDTRRDAQGRNIHTFAIVTTEANELMRPIHPRMPVILRQDRAAAWLDAQSPAAAALDTLLAPYAADGMDAYEVSPLVNSPANDSPACAARLSREPFNFPA